ncbi:glycerol-3-phosphate 1-O-acyltransferase PlsY [Psychrobium sp. 1_MG-2023]|uniref:glycerol-3-phosphate 1-O-acyltransferase PlsY n=1 Tax=Psychrobium sp. 1_MG-2023 TaxID=3062624 RepID=UPI000C33FDA7|nr:glycerol-3-phosphate 1-O-acyltransferase PlsY [Psychrobium sp. 1_MG-2023]MDP2560742.1 glycerol-3-phosphate 1-O-acyltransferase PlsY [Psychrobium sp. 1_MG-2023]PKF56635.1 glycerol-3-phosphate acyltransferase [Alteromonadales bacterium alter-6D02]
MIIPLTILMLILAYLSGSLSSAVIVSRVYKLPDPRLHGSGNPGTTNVLRIGGPIPAVLVLVGDLLKGTIPVWCSYFLDLPPVSLGIVAIAACLGHIFPIFFEFKGGKGVATALGSILPIGLDLTGLLLGSWLVALIVTGYSSFAAICAAILAPLFTYAIKPDYTLPVTMLCVLIIIRHHPNIMRLLKGEEPTVWKKFNKDKDEDKK